MKTPLPSRILIAVFLLIVGTTPLVQMLAELGHGERPQLFDLFTQCRNQADLRSFEQAVERASVTIRALRPWMQAAQFFGLHEAGGQALVGRDGWIFYAPGVAATTQRPTAGNTSVREAIKAITDFRDQLASRGIHLLIVPVPNKASVYPDKLDAHAVPSASPLASDTRQFFMQCKNANIDVVDLFAIYQDAREQSDTELYLHQDSHWSPAGMKRAVAAVAERIHSRGSVIYDIHPELISRHGDLVRMLRSPPIESSLVPDRICAEQVRRHADNTMYEDDPASPVLVLGDSFLRIYEQDEPGQAGFIAHLARMLGHPLTSIVNDGGASTLVRQELFRRPQLLAGKQVVVWEFVERDLRLGTEGWQCVPVRFASP